MVDYPVSARAYLQRARDLISDGSPASFFYAAFELRCGVEARLKEYLEPHDHIPEGRRTEWRVTNLHRTTQAVFQLADQISRVRITRAGHGSPIATLFYTPVSTRLRALAERFGNYLHAQSEYRSPDAPFWANLRAELDEAVHLLTEATTGTLLGPMLRKSGTKQANMPVELLPDDPQNATALKDLKGVDDLLIEVRYFPDLISAQAE